MREYHNFKIHAPATKSGAYVEMDGERLNGVVAVAFEVSRGKPTTITLTMIGNIDTGAAAEF